MVARWGEAPPPVLQGDRVLAAGWDGPPPTPAAMPPGTWNLTPGTWKLPPGTWNLEPDPRHPEPAPRSTLSGVPASQSLRPVTSPRLRRSCGGAAGGRGSTRLRVLQRSTEASPDRRRPVKSPRTRPLGRVPTGSWTSEGLLRVRGLSQCEVAYGG